MRFKSVWDIDRINRVAKFLTKKRRNYYIYIFVIIFIILIPKCIRNYNENPDSLVRTCVLAGIGMIFVGVLVLYLHKKEFSKVVDIYVKSLGDYTDEKKLIRDCEMKSDRIVINRPDGTNIEHFLSDIDTVGQTGDMIVVILKTHKVMTIEKSTIEGGTVDELINILSKKGEA